MVPRNMSTLADPDTRGIDDVEPCHNETLDRILTGTVTVVPVLCLLLVAWQVWGDWLGWNDIFVFLIMYVSTALGVTVGFHRMLTHRSFKTSPFVRGVFTAFGSAAIEGPAISWVADHRKHHAFSDKPGDPHSPHVDHGTGWRGAIKGLTHAHVGWLFLHTHRGRRTRYAPDLLADPVVRAIDRRFTWCVAAGLIAPFLLGWAFGGTLRDGLTGLLWGGAVRVLVLHHATYSINSLCHFFGSRRFATRDESRNLLWLAPLTMGEAWHNNHHAFPTSAAHGLRRWEIDPSAWVITAMEKVGLVWDVVRISPERQATKYADVA
jgi:stearoyl-CoA desaturase (Delta-9 desaturase)